MPGVIFISYSKTDKTWRERVQGHLETLQTWNDADVWADEPIWKDGAVVGMVTSGGYAHFADKSVAIGFVPVGMIAPGAAFEIEILGEFCPATLIDEPLFDPNGERMRG